MAGGLLQLAGYGNQDIYLTGSPLISYFKVVYRRYTNFSMENISLDMDKTELSFNQQKQKETVCSPIVGMSSERRMWQP
jgi:hypothetical protein